MRKSRFTEAQIIGMLKEQEAGLPSRVQAIAVEEDNAAQHMLIVDAGLAMALGTERLEALHLPLRQPVKIAHPSGLLAEPESSEKPEINGSAA